MNKILNAAERSALADLIQYQEGKIANLDIVDEAGAKFSIMAFDAGTAIPENVASEDALLFVLEGDGVIVCGGREHIILKGENFSISKGVTYFIKATTRFKMALLLTIDK